MASSCSFFTLNYFLFPFSLLSCCLVLFYFLRLSLTETNGIKQERKCTDEIVTNKKRKKEKKKKWKLYLVSNWWSLFFLPIQFILFIFFFNFIHLAPKNVVALSCPCFSRIVVSLCLVMCCVSCCVRVHDS